MFKQPRQARDVMQSQVSQNESRRPCPLKSPYQAKTELVKTKFLDNPQAAFEAVELLLRQQERTIRDYAEYSRELLQLIMKKNHEIDALQRKLAEQPNRRKTATMRIGDCIEQYIPTARTMTM